jgi:hypothetical protein
MGTARTSTTHRDERTSPSLRIVLQELDRSGSGSLEFWRVYWAAFPRLTDVDLVRVARVVGPLGRRYLWALTAAAAQTGERA